MPQWISRKYPDGCRSCGRTDVKHSAQGLCGTCYGKPEILAAAKAGTLEGSEDESLSVSDADDFGGVVDRDDAQPLQGVTGERRPGSLDEAIAPDEITGPAPKETLGDKAKKLFGAKKPPKSSTPWGGGEKEKRPTKVTRRTSTAESLEDVWTGLGGIAIRTGVHAPLGRYLTWQAPAAGEMLDAAVEGTFIDKRFLQPAVKARGRLDMAFAVLGPPGIILAIERNPNNAPMLIPLLKSAIRSSLPTMLPAMKKAQEREKKVDKAVVEMFPELAGTENAAEVAVDQIISQMFFGWEPEESAPQEAEEGAPVNA